MFWGIALEGFLFYKYRVSTTYGCTNLTILATGTTDGYEFLPGIVKADTSLGGYRRWSTVKYTDEGDRIVTEHAEFAAPLFDDVTVFRANLSSYAPFWVVDTEDTTQSVGTNVLMYPNPKEVNGYAYTISAARQISVLPRAAVLVTVLAECCFLCAVHSHAMSGLSPRFFRNKDPKERLSGHLSKLVATSISALVLHCVFVLGTLIAFVWATGDCIVCGMGLLAAATAPILAAFLFLLDLGTFGQWWWRNDTDEAEPAAGAALSHSLETSTEVEMPRSIMSG